MSPTVDLEELIARPLDAIERLRNELEAVHSGETIVLDESAKVAGIVSEALLSGHTPALTKVPSLTRKALSEGKLPPNSLVRYRGMVQDQYEPEYFVGSFEQLETATGQRSRVHVKYADAISHKPGFVNEYDGAGAKTMERLPLFCVPVPGLSPWARPQEEDTGVANAAETTSGQSLSKRQREAEMDAMDCTDADDNTSSNEYLANGHKKSSRAPDSAVNRTGQDGAKNGTVPATAFEHRQELELDGLACVVKVYDFREGLLKLNDTAEFVGILAYDVTGPSLEDDSPRAVGADGLTNEGVVAAAAATGMSDPFKGLEDFSRKVPPPSLAPRLHCIFHRMVPACAPLEVAADDSKFALYAMQGPLPFGTFMQDAKRQAIEHLAKALGGDALAAEYVLLTLLSRAYVRTEALAPGSLSLNLRGVPVNKASAVHAAVAELVPKSVLVPVTTSSLSEQFKFAPKKDYNADRLMLSSLQLSDGTVVVLDETELETGQIGTEGVGNLAALNSLLSLQKIPYDFGFYKMDFEVDHPSISLSQNRSVVATSTSFPVVSGSGCGAIGTGWNTDAMTNGHVAVNGGTETAALTRLRVYIEATRRMELSLDAESSRMAEEDFVKARQQGQTVTGEDFHRWLTVARLTAMSVGDSTMTAAHWSHMKNLEAKVAARQKDENGADGGDRAKVPSKSFNKPVAPSM